jgi:hypothetical protein
MTGAAVLRHWLLDRCIPNLQGFVAMTPVGRQG